jgi:hypothetical protein
MFSSVSFVCSSEIKTTNDEGTFWGVSTKYLQNYLNRFYMREKFKHESITTEKMALASLQNIHAIKQYGYNNFAYDILLATQF